MPSAKAIINRLLIWIAWHLPGNVTTYTFNRGHRMRNLNNTVGSWVAWRLRQLRNKAS